jgi:DtxR family transcriptional regulator, Mn-dependent transcriptional regulator
MSESNQLSASLEDYLEAIYHIVAKKQAARAKDIADKLQVKSSSVTGALRALAERKLVNYAPYDLITLTPHGQEIARDVIRRHEVLLEFFTKVLAIDGKEADESACLMEHAIQPNILERFIKFLEFMDTCPRMKIKWISGEGGYHCDTEPNRTNCEKCILDIMPAGECTQ